MSRTASGERVTPDTAGRLAAVFACERVISEGLAALPLCVYRRTADDGRERATDHPAYRVLHESPNEEMTAYTWKQQQAWSGARYGNALSLIRRKQDGTVVDLWPLDWQRVRLERNERTGKLVYVYRPAQSASDELRLRADEVLHVRPLTSLGVIGLNPIEQVAETFGAALATEKYAATFFRNDATPSGVLSFDASITPEKADEIRQAWTDRNRGVQNERRHGVAVVGAGGKFTPLEVDHQQLQFLESRKFTRSEIAGIYRVPPHMIGDLERATFSNITEMSRGFLDFTLRPWLTNFEQSLTVALLSAEERAAGYYVEFNVADLMRAQPKEQAEAMSIQIQSGQLTPNEARRAMNRPSMEGGDRLFINSAAVPLDAAGFPDDVTTEDTEGTEPESRAGSRVDLARSEQSNEGDGR